MVFFSVLIFIRAGIRGKLKDKTVAKQTITYSLVIDKNGDKIYNSDKEFTCIIDK
jgi:hypothetical protein